MKSIAPTTPYGYTIFCDDVRMEVGNKPSYMGIYSGGLNVHKALPTTLAKFACAIYYFERPGESTSPVKLRIYLPWDEETPVIEAEIPIEDVRTHPVPNRIKGEDHLIGVVMHFALSPFKVQGEGLIKVRAYRDDLEIRLGAIEVSHHELVSTKP